MILQVEIWAVVGGVIAALILAIFFLSRRGQTPAAPAAGVRAYTPGEEEILRRLGELRDRIERFIPPYGRVGYVPQGASELAQLLGFSYIKINGEEYGTLPDELKDIININLDVDLNQIKIKDKYIYIIKKNNKKMIAIGDLYLDYLTLRFLEDFLDYLA